MMIMMMVMLLVMMTITSIIMIIIRTSIIITTVISQPSRPISHFLALWPAAPAGGARLPRLTSAARVGPAAALLGLSLIHI